MNLGLHLKPGIGLLTMFILGLICFAACDQDPQPGTDADVYLKVAEPADQCIGFDEDGNFIATRLRGDKLQCLKCLELWCGAGVNLNPACDQIIGIICNCDFITVMCVDGTFYNKQSEAKDNLGMDGQTGAGKKSTKDALDKLCSQVEKARKNLDAAQQTAYGLLNC